MWLILRMNINFEKDGIMEDAVEEMVIELGGDKDESDKEEHEDGMVDNDDRQLITKAL